MRNPIQLLGAAAIVAASSLLLPACGSTEKRAEEATSDILATKAELDAGLAEVEVVLAKLDAMTDKQATDLEDRFEAYEDEIKSLDKIAAEVRDRADRMKASGDRYFDAWSKELDSATPAEADAHTRRLKQYQDINTSFQQLRESYRPFVATIKEVRDALDKETTFVEVTRLAPQIKTARDQGAGVKLRLEYLLERLRVFALNVKAGAAGGTRK